MIPRNFIITMMEKCNSGGRQAKIFELENASLKKDERQQENR
jgi:hypothetical protein